MSVLRPRLVLDHVTEITPTLLAACGVRGLLLDLDNTLIEYGSYRESREVQTWASEIMLSGIQLYLLSNATPERARFWSEKLGFPGRGMSSKPVPGAFRAAARFMGLAPHQVAMVGDQLFTDMLGGNLAGMYTILIRPLADNALPHTRLARRVERLVLRRYGVRHWGKHWGKP